MKARISITCLFVFLLSTTGALWGFPGFAMGEGTHTEITRTAAARRFDIPTGTLKRERVVPVYGIHWFDWETAYYADLFCEASRDIDINYFGPTEAHSQSPSYEPDRRFTKEELNSFELDAVCRSLSFYAGLMERARGELEAGNTIWGVYLVGLAVHVYEDLFSHDGMTNEQHVWLEKNGDHPDYVPASVEAAREAMDEFFTDLPSVLGQKAYTAFREALTSREPIVMPTRQQKRKYLGRPEDVFIEGIKYTLLKSPDSCMEYSEALAWDRDTVCRMYNSRDALDRVLSMEDFSGAGDLLREYGYRY